MTNRDDKWLNAIAGQTIEEFLESLLGMRQEIRCLRERKDTIAQQITSVSAAKLTGKVTGGGPSDLSQLLERLEEAKTDVVRRTTELLCKEALASLLIRKHPDEMAKVILRARYIIGDSWKHITRIICGYKDVSYPQKIKRQAITYLSQHTSMQEIIAEAKIKRLIK